MASIIPIVAAVKRHKQQKAVQAELEASRRERQEAAEERRQMQEMLQAHVNSNNTNSNNNGYPPQEYGYASQPAIPGYGYPQAEGAPLGSVQPLGTPVQGMPVQSVVYASNPSYATAQSQPGTQTVVVIEATEYCRVCERYHALPKCQQTRREQREERRELRHEQKMERREQKQERREERREEKQERREARRNR